MKKLFLFLVCAVACSWYFTAGAKSVRVNNNAGAGANYPSLEAAVAAVAPGDTIYLEGSVTAYTLPVLGKKVTIIGPGYYLTENPNTLANQLNASITGDISIAASAAGAIIEGVVFERKSGMSFKLKIGANNTIIRRCLAYCVLSFDNSNSTTKEPINNITITQCCLFWGFDNYSPDRAYNAVITNNICTSNSIIFYVQNSLIEYNTFPRIDNIRSADGCTVRNNIFKKVGLTDTEGAKLSNNHELAETDFISETGASSDGKYRLNDYSPAMTAGTNGGQVGAFGGATPYVLSGLPDVPHIYNVEAPTAGSAASGLKVTVKVKTDK